MRLCDEACTQWLRMRPADAIMIWALALNMPCLSAVVPFVHSGMDQVLPKGSACPRIGQSIKVLVGEPIAVADLQETATAEQWPDHVLYSAIADRIGHSLHMLKARLEGMPVSEVIPSF